MVVLDPVSLIVAALAAGASEGTKTTVSEAVKDAYAGLKRLVKGRFVGRASGEVALAKYEEKPQLWAGALEAELAEVDAGRDRVVVEAAQRLMALVDAAGSQAGKYLVDVRGGQGVQVGDHNTQSNTFTAPPAL